MPLDRAALRARLLASFREEARERLSAIGDTLVRWSHQGATSEAMELLFREVHSLKGGARAAGLAEVEQLSHHWESLLAPFRSAPDQLTDHVIELSRASHRLLERQLGEDVIDTAAFHRLIDRLQGREKPLAEDDAESDAARASDVRERTRTSEASARQRSTVRVDARRLDEFLVTSEELQHLRRSAHNVSRTTSQVVSRLHQGHGYRGIPLRLRAQLQQAVPDTSPALRDLIRETIAYLDWSHAQIESLADDTLRIDRDARALARELQATSDEVGRLVDDLLLLPATSLLDGMSAMVEDLAESFGKQVDLVVDGAGLRLDKRILDELRPVLTHLLRNAIDHGIELPEERAKLGKARKGYIGISFVAEAAGNFRLVVKDDGRGIDLEKIRAHAVRQGLVEEDEAESLDLVELVFMNGVTTSQMITEISGRGVGMAAVREVVERLGGHIELVAPVGEGATVVLSLPLTVSSFRAVIVRCDEHVYAIPALNVERSIRLPMGAVKTVENRPSVAWGGDVLAVWSLAELLGLPPVFPAEDALSNFVVLIAGGERHALFVDDVLDDQEISVKPLGPQLRRVRAVMGAGVLGDGTLVPILHPGDLSRIAKEHAASTLGGPIPSGSVVRKQLLVVDDSFTSRGLLKSILEAAGYDVTTANDGQEAWILLKREVFDLLVADVEMPKMDGFTLTAKVRADRKLADLPVVLVTALQTAEDRARGLEAGANAYLVKSGFEQDSLLDAISRLI